MHNRAIGFLILYGSAMLVAFVFPPAGVWGFLFESNYHPPFNRWWGRAIMSLGDRWSFYIGAVMVLAVLLNWSRYQAVPFWKHTQSKLLILFSINACVVTVFAYDMDASWNEMVDNLKWLLVYFCIIKTHSDRRWLPVILYIYIFAAIDAGWQTTFDPKSGRFVRGGPVTASVDENFVASHMIALLPMVAFYAFSPNIERWLRAICLLGAPLMLNVVAHAQSRGAFLALAAAGAVLPLVAKGRLRGIAIVVLLLGALASARLFHQQFWDRMGTIETYQEDGSAEGRIAAWKDAWDLSLQNPFGYGGEAFDRGLKRVSKTTHNMYFECLVAWGFQGTLIWLGFIGVTC
ncbi:MAG: O-antigen ligase family protein, partial [Haliea sp.]